MSPVREAAPPWQVLIGPFAADHIEVELEQGGPLLLVPNNLELAAELAEQFQGRGEGRLYFSRELLGAEDREVCWYRYNDPRFDGVSPPEPLIRLAPNLKLRDLQLRHVVRLDSLIHGWANHDPALAALVSGGGGRIWVQSKQPAPIVAGVSRIIEVIREICWTPLGSPGEGAEGESELATVAEWLERSCFRPAERRRVNDHSAALSLVWAQDPLLLSESRLERQAAEIAQLREAKQELEGLAEQRRAELERRDGEIGSLREACDALREQGEALREECDALRPGIAALREELAAAQAELGSLREAKQELEGLAEQRRAELELRDGEIGSLREECDALRPGIGALREELAAAQAELGALRGADGELARLRQEGEELRARLAEAVTEIDAIVALLATPAAGVTQG